MSIFFTPRRECVFEKVPLPGPLDTHFCSLGKTTFDESALFVQAGQEGAEYTRDAHSGFAVG
jgi:hypothetical protein